MARIYVEDLQAAVKILGTTVPRKPNIPALANILIEVEPNCVTLSASDLVASLRVQLPAAGTDSWSLTVPPVGLDSRHSSAAVATLTPAENNTLVLTLDKQSQRTKGIAADQFPPIPRVDAAPLACLPAVQLKRAINFVAEVIGQRCQVIETVIREGQLILTARDGDRAFRSILAVDSTAEYVGTLPAAAWQRLAKLVGSSDVQMGADGDRVAFAAGNVELVTQRVDFHGRANIDALLETRPLWAVNVRAADLKDAVKHARVINKETLQFKVTRYRDDKAMWGMSAVAEIGSESPEVGSGSADLLITFDVVPGSRQFDLGTPIIYDAIQQIGKVANGDVTIRFEGPLDPFMVEAHADGLTLVALTYPIVAPVVKPVTYPSEEDKQKQDHTEARTAYDNWIDANFDLASRVEQGQRQDRAARMVTLAKLDYLKPDELIDFYQYYLMGDDLPGGRV